MDLAKFLGNRLEKKIHEKNAQNAQVPINNAVLFLVSTSRHESKRAELAILPLVLAVRRVVFSIRKFTFPDCHVRANNSRWENVGNNHPRNRTPCMPKDTTKNERPQCIISFL